MVEKVKRFLEEIGERASLLIKEIEESEEPNKTEIINIISFLKQKE